MNNSNLWDIDLQTCIDKNLNYHYMEKGPLDNKFDNYTYNSLKYFKNCKKILDVGCGYGGPSSFLLSQDANLEISCITNSQSQYDIVSKKFDCYLTDASEFRSDLKFDIVVFFDSLCLMDAESTLENISKCTNKIFIKDYIHFDKDYYYTPRWEMTFRSENNWRELLGKYGFEVKHFEINDKVLVKESHEFWNKQVENSISTHRQIEMLKTISKSKQLKEGKGHCLLYAEKI